MVVEVGFRVSYLSPHSTDKKNNKTFVECLCDIFFNGTKEIIWGG